MRRLFAVFGFRNGAPHLLLQRDGALHRLLDEPLPGLTFQRDEEYAGDDARILWACLAGEPADVPPGAPPGAAWHPWDQVLRLDGPAAGPDAGPEAEALASALRKVTRLSGRRWICTIVGCKSTSARFTDAVSENAFTAGRIAAELGFAVLTGGLGGVMSRAAEGARSAGGTTIGILPGEHHDDANPHIGLVLPSGIGYARNYLTAVAGDVMVALAGGTGTLEEICFAVDFQRPVLSWGSWELPETTRVPEGDARELQRHMVRIMNEKFRSRRPG